MTTVVIVDSEAKARAIAEQSGGAHETLLLRSAPMQVSHHAGAARLYAGEAGFQFVPAETEREFVKALLANLHKDIYVALESDQQGEYWSWMLSRFVFAAAKGRKGVRRIHVSGFAGEELAESFRRVEPVRESAAAASYIRALFNSCLLRHLHRLLGTVHGPGGLLLDFAALTALALLEERAAEADAFAAPAKWRLAARVSTPAGTGTVRLLEAYEITDDGFFRDTGEMKRAMALFAGWPLTVMEVTQSDFAVEPPMPYRLAELLHDACTLAGMGPGKVLHGLRKLHAGLVVGGRRMGLISAPFAMLPPPQQTMLARIRDEVTAVYGSGELIEREPEEHVILPLLPGLAGDRLQDALSAEERRLYDLIRDRALASQMPAARGRNLLMACGAGGCLFEGRGRLLTDRGFLKAFAAGYDLYLQQDCPLQDLQAGQELAVEQVIPEQSAGVTVEYYGFESFSQDMAEFSVPLEPGLLLMLQEMLDKGYLAVDAGGGFHAEGNMGKVTATLNRAFPAMKGISLPAYFEQTVGEVLSGRKSLDFALKQFEQNFVMHGVPLVRIQVPRAVPVRERKSKNIIKGLAAEEHPRPATAGEAAPPPVTEVAAVSEAPAMEAEEGPAPSPRQVEPPATGGAEAAPMETVSVEEMNGIEETRTRETAAEAAPPPMTAMAETRPEAVFDGPLPPAGENGQPAAAAQVPPADAAVDAPAPAEAGKDRLCPDCGRPLVLQSDRLGRYWACSGYPACRHAESCAVGEEKMELPCPLCGQESLAVKRTATGRNLYVCPAEGCEFMAWSRPHAVTCPSCGSPFLVEKKTAGGRMILRCPRAGCSYRQSLAGGQGEDEAARGPAPARKRVLVRRPAGSSGGTGRRKVLVRRKKG